MPEIGIYDSIKSVGNRGAQIPVARSPELLNSYVGAVTVCLTCPTSVATIFVARRKHGSLSRNIREELDAILLFQ